VVVAGKHALPQWLSMDAAAIHCTEGLGIWKWASNDQDAEPDVVMACCGDTPTLEILAAVSILREHLPDLRIRVINVVDLMKLQSHAPPRGWRHCRRWARMIQPRAASGPSRRASSPMRNAYYKP
jgi:phosphoketolase